MVLSQNKLSSLLIYIRVFLGLQVIFYYGVFSMQGMPYFIPTIYSGSLKFCLVFLGLESSFVSPPDISGGCLLSRRPGILIGSL